MVAGFWMKPFGQWIQRNRMRLQKPIRGHIGLAIRSTIVSRAGPEKPVLQSMDDAVA